MIEYPMTLVSDPDACLSCMQAWGTTALLQRAVLAARAALSQLDALRALFDVEALAVEGEEADVRPQPSERC